MQPTDFDLAMDHFFVENLEQAIAKAREQFGQEEFAHMKGLADSYLNEIELLIQQMTSNADADFLYFDAARKVIERIVINYRDELSRNAPAELQGFVSVRADVSQDPLAISLESMCTRVEEETITVEYISRARAHSLLTKIDQLPFSTEVPETRARKFIRNIMENRASAESAYGGPVDKNWVEEVLTGINKSIGRTGDLKNFTVEIHRITEQVDAETSLFLHAGQRDTLLTVDQAYALIDKFSLVKPGSAAEKGEPVETVDPTLEADRLLSRSGVSWELEQVS